MLTEMKPEREMTVYVCVCIFPPPHSQSSEKCHESMLCGEVFTRLSYFYSLLDMNETLKFMHCTLIQGVSATTINYFFISGRNKVLKSNVFKKLQVFHQHVKPSDFRV